MEQGQSLILPVAKELYKNRGHLKTAWDWIVSKTFGRKFEFGFTGVSGVGKTILFDHINGSAFDLNYIPKGRSIDKESDVIHFNSQKGQDKKRIAVTVAPGQDSSPKVIALNELFSKSNLSGIVHVVANGFATTREIGALEILKESNVLTVEEYRNLQLQREIEELEAVCSKIETYIQSTKKPLWMIVAVTKIDLYYDDLGKAMAYYTENSNSRFDKVLKNLQQKVGKNNFSWIAVPVSSWIEKFEYNGEVVRPQIDIPERDHFLANFTEVLKSYCI